MIYRVIAAAALAATPTSHAPRQPQTILFDLGSPSQQASGAVNHVTAPGQIGLLLQNAEDTLGELTAVAFRQLDGWCGINLKGTQGDEPYPSRAMQDSSNLSIKANLSSSL